MFGNQINPKKIKKQNTMLLKKLGIDVIDHLPWIEPRSQRSENEIANRCVVLAAVLHLYFGAPTEFIHKYLIENDLINYLSPEEHNLLDVGYDNLKEQDKINLFWTIEAVWALTWVGGFHNNLTFNTEVEDTLASKLPDFENSEPANSFIEGFSKRSDKEVFVELDKFYRAHWFARNLDLNQEQSPQVDLDIIMERRKALEWVADSSIEWDDISLDT